MQRYRFGHLGATATPSSYTCLAFPNTPGCPPKTTTTATTTTPTPTVPVMASSSTWATIPVWLKIAGAAVLTFAGYKLFIAK